MGCLSSKPAIVDFAAGDDKAYMERYLEDRVLGEGEFGVVHLVHDVKNAGRDAEPYAAKTLKKGMTFKDNTLWTPIKPEVLRRECNILRVLEGKRFVLKLIGIYESSSNIHIVTEFCSGGDMTEYVINAYGKDRMAGLRTEDVSRISYQLLSAVDHCANHGVIHRDIKPENIMFRTPERGAELRLIDFGSSSMDDDPASSMHNSTTAHGGAASDNNELQEHTTFAGSAFYIAPEVFQRTYNSKADVWSVGVTLYVLVAGYPSECLQKAFNLIQRSKRDLREMPNMPPNMPDSYYEMLDQLLVYHRRKRHSAGEVLSSEFVKFHQDHAEGSFAVEEGEESAVGMSLDDVAKEANAAPGTGSIRNGSTGKGRTMSVLLEGSVQRHTLYVQYEKFERSVTTLLATVLSPNQLVDLLGRLNSQNKFVKGEEQAKVQEEAANGGSSSHRNGSEEGVEVLANKQKLQIIKIKDLKAVLLEMGLQEPATMMSDLPNASSYESFAYHIALLRQFVRIQDRANKGNLDSSRGKLVRRLSSMGTRGSGGNGSSNSLKKTMSGGDLATHRTLPPSQALAASMPPSAMGNGKEKDTPNSVHGSNVFKDFRKKRDQRNAVMAANNATIDSSTHSQ